MSINNAALKALEEKLDDLEHAAKTLVDSRRQAESALKSVKEREAANARATSQVEYAIHVLTTN